MWISIVIHTTGVRHDSSLYFLTRLAILLLQAWPPDHPKTSHQIDLTTTKLLFLTMYLHSLNIWRASTGPLSRHLLSPEPRMMVSTGALCNRQSFSIRMCFPLCVPVLPHAVRGSYIRRITHERVHPNHRARRSALSWIREDVTSVKGLSRVSLSHGVVGEVGGVSFVILQLSTCSWVPHLHPGWF